MLWARIEIDGRTLAGQIDGDRLVVHAGEIFAGPSPTGETVPLADARWLAPCRPGKIVALWNNFHAAATKNGWAVPAEPLYFLKSTGALNRHLAPIAKPASYDGRVVYEGELGIVIGRRCRNVAAAEAPAHIFGYTCVNDVTALDLLSADASFAQWTRAKGFDGFAPIGPAIATGLDPAALVVRTLVNGRERQNYPAADMIFPPAELVSRISRDLTLDPGDVIACGTSLGVLPMRPGTTVEIAIDGIGTLKNIYG
ncbi:MAG: fumarylacetoacetate hydrolase family protein [Proteobacteria bacterium]|nr:fumarylacetoacetate hydrolase family protein [Pseudomonadota bacterium]